MHRSNDLKLNSKNSKNSKTRKVLYITQYIGQQVPNFHPFRSTISHFQDIAHFGIFPLTPMLKFQSATDFLIFGRSPKHITLHSFIALFIIYYIFIIYCLIYHKVWLRSDKNCRRSSILKYPAPYGPVLTKL